MQDFEGAIADFTQSIQLGHLELHLPYSSRGFIQQSLGRYQAAIEDFTAAIELNPEFANAYVGRGLAQTELGNSSGAIADYQVAAKLYQQQGDTTRYQNVLDKLNALE